MGVGHEANAFDAGYETDVHPRRAGTAHDLLREGLSASVSLVPQSRVDRPEGRGGAV